MKIDIDIDEKTVSLLRSCNKKDIASIITEALAKWITENVIKCPIDEDFCIFNEPCNSCPKVNKSK